MKTRKADLLIYYEGVNISQDIKNDIEGFTFTDNASGSADDISLSLNNTTKKWINEWQPIEGDVIKAVIQVEKEELECGVFHVDDIGFNFPPAALTINAVSTPVESDYVSVKHSNSFLKTSLKSILGQITKRHAMRLTYDAKLNPMVAYVEQKNESDSEFVDKLCQHWGLSVKVFNHQLVIFSEAEYEKKKPVSTLDLTDFTEIDCKKRKNDCDYDGATISYSGGTYKFAVPGKSGTKILEIDDNVTAYEEAKVVAKSKLREKNREGMVITGTVVGNTKLIACATVKITGLGFFDGVYYIDKATHALGAYKTSLELHRILEGY